MSVVDDHLGIEGVSKRRKRNMNERTMSNQFPRQSEWLCPENLCRLFDSASREG